MRRALVLTALSVGCAAPPAPPPRPSTAPAPAPTTSAGEAPRPPADPAFGLARPATIAVAETFACAILSDQRVACWGDNRHGQLGDGTDQVRQGPVVVAGLVEVVEVAAGAEHACVRRRDGQVWCWGEGAAFRLGQAADVGPHRPRPVPQVASAVTIAASVEHSCAILAGGTVRCWGDPSRGKLGLDHLDHVTEPANVPLPVERATGLALGDETTCVRDGGGRVHCWGVGHRFDANQRRTLDGIDEAVALFGARYRTCIRDESGTVRCLRAEGELTPLEEAPSDATAFALGGSFGCALTGAGLRCWGTGPWTDDPDPVEREGGDEAVADSARLAGPDEPIEIGAAGQNLCVRSAAGAVYCAGDNDQGQLGRSPGGRYPVPVAVPFAGEARDLAVHGATSCVIGRDGTIRCWGESGLAFRQPGRTFVVEPLDHVRSLALGSAHGCAVHGGGKVACWGYDADGQMGRGPPPPSPEPDDQARTGWAALGLPSSLSRDRFVVAVDGIGPARDVAVSRSTSCAATDHGVWCWGDTGLAPTSGSSSACPSLLERGDAQRCAEQQVPRRVPSSHDAEQVVAGQLDHCLRRTDGSVACWRRADLARGDPPETVDAVGDVRSLRVGAKGTICALDGAGALVCWRDRAKAQVVDHFGDPLVDWAGGERFECAVTRLGRVLCRGAGGEGQLGNGATPLYQSEPTAVVGIDDAVAVAIGRRHGCALLRAGPVRCWGRGDEQMGRPRDVLRSSPKLLRIDLPGSPKPAR